MRQLFLYTASDYHGVTNYLSIDSPNYGDLATMTYCEGAGLCILTILRYDNG
jgi:hypothetical protein